MGQTEYSEKLDTLNSQFKSILGDYKKYYIFSNKNPEYQDYVNAYENARSTIDSISSQVFSISTQVESKLNSLINNSENLNKKIQEEKKIQTNLKKNLILIKTNVDGANIMIDNYKETYKEQYIKNSMIFFGLFLELWLLFKVFSKK